jgi:hypothetical protein
MHREEGDQVPVVESEEILKRAELVRKELRALTEEPLSAQGQQRISWVLHDIDLIVAAALRGILADDTAPRPLRGLLG